MFDTFHPAHVLWYNQPATSWNEALPLGNGRLGAMVFGGIKNERIALNDDTLWSGHPQDKTNPQAKEILDHVRRLIFQEKLEEAGTFIQNKMLGDWTESYLPLGDLDLFRPQMTSTDLSNYSRWLDLRTATAETTWQNGAISFRQTVFTSYPDQVLVLYLTADQPGSISVDLSLTSQLQHKLTFTGESDLLLQGRAPLTIAHESENSPDPVKYDPKDANRTIQFVIRGRVLHTGGVCRKENGRICVGGADQVLFMLTSATSFRKFDQIPNMKNADPVQESLDILDRANDRNWSDLLARHVIDHKHLYDRVCLQIGSSYTTEERNVYSLPPLPAVSIDPEKILPQYQPALPTTLDRLQDQSHMAEEIDPNMICLLFHYGRYLLIASSRPGTQAANLQGIWSEHVQAPWQSNYTTNINTQMNYWPAEVCNLSECHRPLFDLISETAISGKEMVKRQYGLQGWTCHHNLDLWRSTGPVGRRYKYSALMFGPWPMGGPWLCQHLWQHYLFTQDRDFLKNKAWPLMKGAAEFCLDWLIPGPDGHLITCPSISPENEFYHNGARRAITYSSTMDISIIRELFASCLAAADILRLDDEFTQKLRSRKAQLPSFLVGSAGQLQEWHLDFAEVEPYHRHLSHLYGLYPGSQIALLSSSSKSDKSDITYFGYDSTPAVSQHLSEACRCSLELRGDEGTGWSLAWKICLWARLMDGKRAGSLVHKLLRLVNHGQTNTGGGVYPNFLTAHPPFQIDANFGFTAGIAEMLLQSNLENLQILPAVPEAWSSGFVRGLCARGGLVIDIRWHNNLLQELVIHARWPYAGNVKWSSISKKISLQKGETITISDWYYY